MYTETSDINNEICAFSNFGLGWQILQQGKPMSRKADANGNNKDSRSLQWASERNSNKLQQKDKQQQMLRPELSISQKTVKVKRKSSTHSLGSENEVFLPTSSLHAFSSIQQKQSPATPRNSQILN